MENKLSEKIQEIFLVCAGIQIDANVIRGLKVRASTATEAELEEIIMLLKGVAQKMLHTKTFLKAKHDINEDKLEETDPAIIILRPEDMINVRNSGTDHWPLRS